MPDGPLLVHDPYSFEGLSAIPSLCEEGNGDHGASPSLDSSLSRVPSSKSLSTLITTVAVSNKPATMLEDEFLSSLSAPPPSCWSASRRASLLTVASFSSGETLSHEPPLWPLNRPSTSQSASPIPPSIPGPMGPQPTTTNSTLASPSTPTNPTHRFAMGPTFISPFASPNRLPASTAQQPQLPIPVLVPVPVAVLVPCPFSSPPPPPPPPPPTPAVNLGISVPIISVRSPPAYPSSTAQKPARFELKPANIQAYAIGAPCDHHSKWKLLRIKKGLAHLLCLECGLKWKSVQDNVNATPCESRKIEPAANPSPIESPPVAPKAQQNVSPNLLSAALLPFVVAAPAEAQSVQTMPRNISSTSLSEGSQGVSELSDFGHPESQTQQLRLSPPLFDQGLAPRFYPAPLARALFHNSVSGNDGFSFIPQIQFQSQQLPIRVVPPPPTSAVTPVVTVVAPSCNSHAGNRPHSSSSCVPVQQQHQQLPDQTGGRMSPTVAGAPQHLRQQQQNVINEHEDASDEAAAMMLMMAGSAGWGTKPSCEHFSRWKRLRIKKGIHHLLCCACGAKWKSTSLPVLPTC